MSDYKKAIELDPEYTSAYFNRGAIKRALQDYGAGILDFTKTLEPDPKDGAAYFSRGMVKT